MHGSRCNCAKSDYLRTGSITLLRCDVLLVSVWIFPFHYQLLPRHFMTSLAGMGTGEFKMEFIKRHAAYGVCVGQVFT